jgi:plastocyanin
MRTLPLVALLSLVACRRAPSAPPPPGRPAAATTPAVDAPAPAPIYRVDPTVLDRPGIIQGTVRWRGAPPAVTPTPVGAGGNPDHCGAAQPDPTLVVGAEGGVSNSVVWLADMGRGAPPAHAPGTVDQRGCRYEPHVLAVPVGAELRFGNSDHGLLHNVHAYYGYDDDDNWFNQASPHGLTVTKRIQRAGVARLICDAGHVWMLAYVHAFTHPYFAVTDAAGRYILRAVPPGRYTLRFWHEGWTRRAMEGTRPRFSAAVETSRVVDVPAGTAVTTDFTLGADAVAAAVTAAR